jgi:uncharacterized coiled-coil protein SlyX
LTTTVSSQGATVSSNSSAISTLQSNVAQLNSSVNSASASPNLIYNPTGALGVANWVNNGTTTISGTSGSLGEGYYFYSSTGSNTLTLDWYQDISYQSNLPVSLQGYINAIGLTKITGTYARAYIRLEWLDYNKSTLGVAGTITVDAGTGWTYSTLVNKTPPSNTYYARVHVGITGDGTWSNINSGWKRLKLEQSTLATIYSDDATPGAISTSVTSNSSAISTLTGNYASMNTSLTTLGSTVSNNSSAISTLNTNQANQSSNLAVLSAQVNTPNINTTQLVPNSTGNTGTIGWNLMSGTGILTTAYDGSSNYLACTSASSSTVWGQAVQITPGGTYTLSGYMNLISFTGSVLQRLRVYYADASKNYISDASVLTINSSIGWHYVSNSSTAPLNAYYAFVIIDLYSTNAFNVTSCGWKKIKFEAGSSPTPWVDDNYMSGIASLVQQNATSISTVDGNIATLSSTVASQGSTLSGLSGSVSTISSSVTTLESNVSTLNTTVSSQGSTISGLSATVSTNAGAITTLQGKTTAYLSQVAAVGGSSAAVKIVADNVSGSAIQLFADSIVLGSQTSPVLAIDSGTGTATFYGSLVANSITTNMLQVGSVGTTNITSSGVTEVLQAYNGSSYSAYNSANSGYWDAITLTVNMAYSGDIVVLLSAKQWYYSGGRDWKAHLTIDGTEIFYTEGGTGAISDSISLSGKLSVGAGNHTVVFGWQSRDSTLAMLAGKASMVTIRRYV